MTDKIIYRALKIAELNGLSQSELAKKMGVSPQSITNWKVRGLPADQYLALADALNCSLDELVNRERFIPTNPQQPWPFDQISEKKLRSLSRDQAIRLEGAVLVAAATLRIDINQPTSTDKKG